MVKMQSVLRSARLVAPAILLAVLAACGGSGGGDDDIGGRGGGNSQFVDANHYSAAANASLSTPNETTGVTHGSLTLGGNAIAYTTTSGHLSALDASQKPEASIFYVAYTADVAPAATRPVTFFFNGGPGSATVWLHLGSFAPKRLSTGIPATTQTSFPYIDNPESLIDTSDLVFVDAVGTGLSEAIAPNTNQSFWGVDKDAAVLRDFISRWLTVNGRTASPLFVFGESYGTTRVPVLARLLETAGQRVNGVVELSSIVDYNSNCSVNGGAPTVNCAGFLPSYAAVGDWWHVASGSSGNLDDDLAAVRSYADSTYKPDADAWLANDSHTLPPASHISALVAFTGLSSAQWQQQFDMDFDTFRHHLFTNTTLGVYDGRMSALVGTPLAADDDPSSTFITPGFQSQIRALLPTLGYTNPSTYVMSSNAIATWDFSHAGRALPDVVPDLGAAMSLDPQLKVLFLGGEHDLITPFHQTELDVARLSPTAPVTLHFHQGGHMTYLDDVARPQMKAELAAFYASATGAQ